MKLIFIFVILCCSSFGSGFDPFGSTYSKLNEIAIQRATETLRNRRIGIEKDNEERKNSKKIITLLDANIFLVALSRGCMLLPDLQHLTKQLFEEPSKGPKKKEFLELAIEFHGVYLAWYQARFMDFNNMVHFYEEQGSSSPLDPCVLLDTYKNGANTASLKARFHEEYYLQYQKALKDYQNTISTRSRRRRLVPATTSTHSETGNNLNIPERQTESMDLDNVQVLDKSEQIQPSSDFHDNNNHANSELENQKLPDLDLSLGQPGSKRQPECMMEIIDSISVPDDDNLVVLDHHPVERTDTCEILHDGYKNKNPPVLDLSLGQPGSPRFHETMDVSPGKRSRVFDTVEDNSPNNRLGGEGGSMSVEFIAGRAKQVRKIY